MTITEEAQKEYDVFLSYQSLDEDFAKKLGEKIQSVTYRGRRLKVFLAPWDVQPGDNIVVKLDKGLANARYFLLLLSPEALKADWPTAERAAAIYSDPSGRLGKVIPAIKRPCKLPPLLAFRNYLDFRQDSNFNAEFSRLISKLTGQPLPSEINPSTLSWHQGIRQESSPLQSLIDSSEPDDVYEEIFSNLFPVKNLPARVYSAPTKFVDRKRVKVYFPRDSIVPPFILKEHRLFTFANLSAETHPFKGVVEDYDIRSELTSEWIQDENRARWLVELLNDCIRVHRFSLGLYLDSRGKKLYYPKGVLASEKINWKAHQRTATRHLIKERKNPQGQTTCFIHRAVDLRFILLGINAFLRIETGRVFSIDGRRLIRGRRRTVLSTRVLSRQRNLAEFDDTRFWAWLLSEDGYTIKMDLGGLYLEINTEPLSTTIRGGIFGDSKILPEIVDSPPDLLGPEEEEEEEVFDEKEFEELDHEGED